MGHSVEEVSDQVVGGVLGAMETLSIAIGDRLGYYRALDGQPMNAVQLAEATSSSARYAREWLEQQAVAGYLTVQEDPGAEPDARVFGLEESVAAVLARPGELTALAPLARQIAAAGAQWTSVSDAARTGSGLGWQAYGADMREAEADLNGPMLSTLLPDEWLPAGFPALYDRFAAGDRLRVADVGAGAAWASIGLARRFPAIHVDAFDVDPDTVRMATANVEAAGLSDRVQVVNQDLADGPPGHVYDLVLAAECIHDIPDPVPVLRSMAAMCGAGGEVLVIDMAVAEAFTAPGDEVERLMYGFSVLVCLPDAMTGNPEGATGTVMRLPTLEDYARAAGFSGIEVLPIDHDTWRFYRLYFLDRHRH